jgi:O-antigen/teichoic acid export membrane protein
MRLATRGAFILLTELFRVTTTLVTGMILSRLLTKADYGAFGQAFMIYTLFSTVLCLSLPQSLYYFIPRAKAEEKPRVMSQTMILMVVLAGITSLAMYFSTPFLAGKMNNPELILLMKVMSFYPLADMISQIVIPALVSIDRANISAIFGTIFSVARITGIVVPLLLGLSLMASLEIMVLVVFGTTLLGLILLVVFFRVKSLWFNMFFLREQLNYAIPMAGALAIGLIGRQLDKWIISLFFGPEQYAVFSNGAQELPIVGVVTAGMASAILPEMVKFAGENKILDALGLWKRSSRVCALVMFPTFVLSLFLSQELMILLFSRKYIDSTYPFIVYLFVLPMRVVIFAAVLRAMSQTRPIMIGAVLALAVNTVLGVGLLKLLGTGGMGLLIPAGASVISQYLSAWYLLHMIKKVSGVPIGQLLPWGPLGKLLALSIAAGVLLLPLWCFHLSLTAKLLAGTGIYMLGYSVIILRSGWLSEEERGLLVRIFRLKRSG